MKLLLENWRQYLNEKQGVTYFWQTRGPWKSESQIEFGVTHVPKAKPFNMPIEKIFEEVRKTKFSDRPSRLNCVYLCDNVKGWDGKSFCSYPASGDGETYQVQLKGNPIVFKTNSELWTEAVFSFQRYEDEDRVRDYAYDYWEGDTEYGTFLEILVSPPESAIIVAKYEEEVPGI